MGTETKKKGAERRKGTGRKKIEVDKRIENIKNRRVTFTKRRQGLFNKAMQFSTMTGCQVAVLAFSTSMKPVLYGDISLLERAADEAFKKHSRNSSSSTLLTSSFQETEPNPSPLQTVSSTNYEGLCADPMIMQVVGTSANYCYDNNNGFLMSPSSSVLFTGNFQGTEVSLSPSFAESCMNDEPLPTVPPTMTSAIDELCQYNFASSSSMDHSFMYGNEMVQGGGTRANYNNNGLLMINADTEQTGTEVSPGVADNYMNEEPLQTGSLSAFDEFCHFFDNNQYNSESSSSMDQNFMYGNEMVQGGGLSGTSANYDNNGLLMINAATQQQGVLDEYSPADDPFNDIDFTVDDEDDEFIQLMFEKQRLEIMRDNALQDLMSQAENSIYVSAAGC